MSSLIGDESDRIAGLIVERLALDVVGGRPPCHHSYAGLSAEEAVTLKLHNARQTMLEQAKHKRCQQPPDGA